VKIPEFHRFGIFGIFEIFDSLEKPKSVSSHRLSLIATMERLRTLRSFRRPTLPTRIFEFASLLVAVFVLCPAAQGAEPPKPPEGFTVLFNGADFSGWHGMGHFDIRKLAE